MSALHDLATAAGLHIDWEDAAGAQQRVNDDALVAILAALDLPADDDRKIADSRHRLGRDVSDTDCAFVIADVGRPINLPRACGRPGPAELRLEDGSRRDVVVERTGDRLRLSPIDAIGDHVLMLGDASVQIAVAPARCPSVTDVAGDARIWGPSVQIPALRDARDTAFGDFATLADAARGLAGRGADALAISPVHALFPADSSRFSPYAPSSRLFLNVLFGDPALAGLTMPPVAQDALIDWEHAIPERMQLLRRAYDGRSDALRATVAAYRSDAGAELERHATFDALHAHFFAQSGARGWRDWPAAFHDPDGTAVARFAGEHAEEVDFYAFLQWLAQESLGMAQRTAREAGMSLGLIADLAVGMDAGGSHAWSRRDDLLTGLSIGAPPDLLGPDGQNWGITGFAPRALQRTGFAAFRATLRTALDHAGGIRIDHALGLRRLWVVPEGASASDGAYLDMPLDDMMRLLALEAHRARAIVIGEDLGTVPEGFRETMADRGMLGMQVLWFERDAEGVFTAPSQWRSEAAALTGTHDLATVAGWWRGHDIEWAWKLGRSRAADEPADRAHRADERKALWRCAERAGLAKGAQPAPDDAGVVVDMALRFVGSTPSAIALIPLEDIAAIAEQPNLPGTIDEHPNWRRRMPEPTATLLARDDVVARIDTLNAARGR